MALNTDTPATLPALLAQRAAAHANEVVLRAKHRGIWASVTWSALVTDVRRLAMALVAHGIAPGDVVGVLSDTRPEAVHADLAAISIGCVSLCLATQDDLDRLGRILHDTRCRLLLVENDEQLDKALLLRDRCPELTHVVIVDMKGLHALDDPMCESLAAFLARGTAYDTAHPAAWDDRTRSVTPDLPAALIPSAGAAAVLTHRDILRLATQIAERLGQHAGDERVAFLPMSGILERVVGLYTALSTRVISNYLENAATLIENLREIQPTILAAPLSVWDQFRQRVATEAANATLMQRVLFNWAIRTGEAAPTGVMAGIARILVLRSVRQNMGLARLRVACTGTNAPQPDQAAWYGALGVSLTGLDELAVPTTTDAQKQLMLSDEFTCAA